MDGCFPVEFWAEYCSGNGLIRVGINEVDCAISFNGTHDCGMSVGIVENGSRSEGFPVNRDGVEGGVFLCVMRSQIGCAYHIGKPEKKIAGVAWEIAIVDLSYRRVRGGGVIPSPNNGDDKWEFPFIGIVGAQDEGQVSTIGSKSEMPVR